MERDNLPGDSGACFGVRATCPEKRALSPQGPAGAEAELGGSEAHLQTRAGAWQKLQDAAGSGKWARSRRWLGAG